MEIKKNKSYEILSFLTEEEIEIISRHKKITKNIAEFLNNLENKKIARLIFKLIGQLKRNKIELTKKILKIFFVKSIFPSIYSKKIYFKQFNEFVPQITKKPKKNICLFTAHLGPGGAERQISILSKLLKEKGYDVTVIVMNMDNDLSHYSEYIKNNGVKLEVLDVSDFERDILFMVRNNINPKCLNSLPNHYRIYAANLIVKLLQKDINIIHCYLDIPNIIGGISSLIIGVPQIRLSFRNTNPSHFPETYNENFKPFYKLLLKYKKRVKLEANNKYGANDYAQWLGINKNTISVVYNGIETNLWSCKSTKIEIREKLNIPKNKFIIISVCRLSEEKKPLDIISITKILDKKIDNLLVIHVGIGNLENEFKQAIQVNNLDKKIITLGKREDIKELLTLADIFLLTSEQEGFPNSIMEAMICGLPIVSTNVGGVPELVKNNVNGYIHKVGDVSNMSKSIYKIYQNQQMAKKISETNYKKILKNFNENIFVKKIIDEYNHQIKIGVGKNPKNKNQIYLSLSKYLINILYKIKKIKNLLPLNATSALYRNILNNFSNSLIVKIYIKHKIIKQFTEVTGNQINFENPVTFNEKLQWLKFYNQDPIITKCADKHLVKDYVKKIIGDEYIIPTIGVWDNSNSIDFNALPDKFVLKTNWGSGQNIIVTDKTKINKNEIKEKLNLWTRPENNHYYDTFEWSYKNIQPKIIAEKYITSKENDLYDYKIMCFNGKPKLLFVCSERFKKLKVTFFDTKWKKLPFTRKYESSNNKIKKPKNLKKMLNISKKLAKNFPFVRVDLYSTGEKIYFGELTFYPGNGTETFTPEIWDYKLGKYLKLPKIK